ncbi:hypothetical protein G419_16580 [Rhodococcus triatomae BKS 15-14]|nr:hypothetical protein G419_16580 [Rhodococcus triatomae BKS 15-14]
MCSIIVVWSGVSGTGAAQGVGLLGAQPLRGLQTPRQGVPSLRVGFTVDRSVELVLAARSGVVQCQGLGQVRLGGGDTALEPGVVGVLDEAGAGLLNTGSDVVQTLTHVRGAPWPRFRFTHRRRAR